VNPPPTLAPSPSFCNHFFFLLASVLSPPQALTTIRLVRRPHPLHAPPNRLHPPPFLFRLFSLGTKVPPQSFSTSCSLSCFFSFYSLPFPALSNDSFLPQSLPHHPNSLHFFSPPPLQALPRPPPFPNSPGLFCFLWYAAFCTLSLSSPQTFSLFLEVIYLFLVIYSMIPTDYHLRFSQTFPIQTHTKPPRIGFCIPFAFFSLMAECSFFRLCLGLLPVTLRLSLTSLTRGPRSPQFFNAYHFVHSCHWFGAEPCSFLHS